MLLVQPHLQAMCHASYYNSTVGPCLYRKILKMKNWIPYSSDVWIFQENGVWCFSKLWKLIYKDKNWMQICVSISQKVVLGIKNAIFSCYIQIFSWSEEKLKIYFKLAFPWCWKYKNVEGRQFPFSFFFLIEWPECPLTVMAGFQGTSC